MRRFLVVREGRIIRLQSKGNILLFHLSFEFEFDR